MLSQIGPCGAQPPCVTRGVRRGIARADASCKAVRAAAKVADHRKKALTKAGLACTIEGLGKRYVRGAGAASELGEAGSSARQDEGWCAA